MRSSAALAVTAVAIALIASGCSLFGPSSKQKEQAAKAEQAKVEASYEPVVAVTQVEMGRTRNGLVITAYGLAPGVGYSMPELRPRRDGKPAPDGYIDYDFVARAPLKPLAVQDASKSARTVRADRPVDFKDLRGTKGIRIHAAKGGMILKF